MKESLTGRVKRIISGSLNAMIDAVEGMAPETVMEEAVREVDEAVDEVRAELGRVAANKHLASTRLMEDNRRHEDLTGKIELAVSEGRDDLAEAAIAKQLDIEAQIPILEQSINEASDREKELEGYIRALQAKKREMEADLHSFRQSRAQAHGDGSSSVDCAAASGSGLGDVQGNVARAASAFGRVLQREAGLPPGAPMPDPKSAVQLAELDEMARKNRVTERLAAMKARAKKDA
jgi:phage shock protein A